MTTIVALIIVVVGCRLFSFNHCRTIQIGFGFGISIGIGIQPKEKEEEEEEGNEGMNR